MTDKKTYIFEQKNSENWGGIHNSCTDTINSFIQQYQKDFSITIGKYNLKSSARQLRSYWLLIGSVQRYMKDQGNNYTKEDVSNYFKTQAGHCKNIMGNPIPKSINYNSNTTASEMNNIINKILEFGLDYNIEDCYIEPTDLKELLAYYKKEINDEGST